MLSGCGDVPRQLFTRLQKINTRGYGLLRGGCVILPVNQSNGTMPKATSKTKAGKPAASPKKQAGKSATPKASAEELIEKACVDALAKLQSLNMNAQLQADLEWCLGSFRHDRNPVGLYQMAERALTEFREAALRKTKGITAKLIKDIEKAISARA